MDSTFIALWIAILILDGLMLWGLTWAATSERFKQYRLRTPGPKQPLPPRKHLNTTLNNLLALLIFIAFLVNFGDSHLYVGWPGTAHFLGETLGVLLLYDFVYYFYHRGMHHPKIMRHVHGVHHFVRFPLADESIYLHPAEQIGAICILLGSMMLLGPISTTSFLMIFFIYSTVNIIVHCNLIIPHPAFRLFNFWVEKHDVHHKRVKNNYSSIFPFWDFAFGTYE